MSIDKAIDCCNYIKNYVNDTPCRKKIIELTEWVFSLDMNDNNVPTVKWYTREGGRSVAFFLRTQGQDHFAIFKLQKKCTQMDLYVRLNKQIVLPPYLIRYPDNQDWARISGENFSSILKDELQGHILNSYHLRLGELGVQTEKNLTTSFVITEPLKKQDHQPTLTEIGKILEKLSRKGDSND